MSTFVSLHYHIVFGTKNRRPLIHESWAGRLHEYLGGAVNSLGGFTQGVGGIEDHVHLLVGLRPTHCISDFMRELKKASSTWVRDVIGAKDFYWQEGYGIFSVSATSVPLVRLYFANQREHHRTKSFKEELVAMLVKAGVFFDERYLDG